MNLFAQLTTYSFRHAMQCIAQPNTALLDCILYLLQLFYDSGILPGKSVHPWNVYVKSNLSRIILPPWHHIPANIHIPSYSLQTALNVMLPMLSHDDVAHARIRDTYLPIECGSVHREAANPNLKTATILRSICASATTARAGRGTCLNAKESVSSKTKGVHSFLLGRGHCLWVIYH